MKDSNVKVTTYKFPLQLAESNDFAGKKRLVGMAYLNENQTLFTLKIWTFSKAKFFILNSTKCASDYFIMTREENNSVNRSSKFHWNIVGKGKVNEVSNLIELSFDLIPVKIFMPLNPQAPTDVGLRNASNNVNQNN